MIDVLGFDESFQAKLSLVAYALTLVGMFWLRRFMAEKSIATIVIVLSVAGAILAMPNIGMFYGLHHWTAAHTAGVVDARFIALIDTALESPLGQIAMIPMLVWIANSAPANLTLTYYASTGAPIVKALVVPANTRHTVLVFNSTEGVGPGVSPLGVVISSDLGVMVEKPAYNSTTPGYGATDTQGVSPSTF